MIKLWLKDSIRGSSRDLWQVQRDNEVPKRVEDALVHIKTVYFLAIISMEDNRIATRLPEGSIQQRCTLWPRESTQSARWIWQQVEDSETALMQDFRPQITLTTIVIWEILCKTCAKTFEQKVQQETTLTWEKLWVDRTQIWALVCLQQPWVRFHLRQMCQFWTPTISSMTLKAKSSRSNSKPNSTGWKTK